MPRKRARPAARARRAKLKEKMRAQDEAAKRPVKPQIGTIGGLGMAALLASIFRRDQ